jgi:hypothetical protein
MRDEHHSAGPGRPDVPVDVAALAELDAGLPGTAEAARRRAAVRADPGAAAVLAALAATRAELSALPMPEVPPEVAARWAAALDAEPPPGRHVETSGRSHPSPDRHTETSGRSHASPDRHVETSRWSGRRPPRRLLAAVAVVVAVAGAGAAALLPRPAPPAATVTRIELVALGRAAVGTMDVGDLADPARRVACLRAVAPAAAEEALLGGRRVVLDGRPGVLLVLATGTPGGLRIVTVDPGCGPDGGTLRAQLVVE